MKRFIEVSKHKGGRTITQRYPARVVGDASLNPPHGVEWVCECGFTLCSKAGPCAPPPPVPVDVLPEGWTRLLTSIEGASAYAHKSGAQVHSTIVASWYWWTAAEVAARVTDTIHDPKPTRDAAMAAALASVQPYDRCCEAFDGPLSECPTHRVQPAPVEPYGCVNRKGQTARGCVESGHYWCELWKVRPIAATVEKPAQPELRPGWKLVDPSHPSTGYIHSNGGWVYRQECGVYREERGLYAARGPQTGYDYDHPTLEAAMVRAEELAELEGSR